MTKSRGVLQVAAEVPDAGEAGEPVVEGDQQADGGDRVGQDVRR